MMSTYISQAQSAPPINRTASPKPLAPLNLPADYDPQTLKSIQDFLNASGQKEICNKINSAIAEVKTRTTQPRPTTERDRRQGSQLFDLYKDLHDWVHSSIDKYKPEFRLFLYPTFVQTYLQLVEKGVDEAEILMSKYGAEHDIVFDYDISKLRSVNTPAHFHSYPFPVAETHEGGKPKVGNPLVCDKQKTPEDSPQTVVHRWRQQRFVVPITKIGHSLLVSYLSAANMIPLFSIVNQFIEFQTSNDLPNYDKFGHMNEHSIRNQQIEVKWGVQDPVIYHEEKQLYQQERPPPAPHCGSDLGLLNLYSAKEIEAIKNERENCRVLGTNRPLPPVGLYNVNQSKHATCATLSKDFKWLAFGGEDGIIRVFMPRMDSDCKLTIESQQAQHRLVGHRKPIHGLEFDKTGSLLLSCSEDGIIKLWNMESKMCVVNFVGHIMPVWCCAFSPHGYYFASGGRDNTARLWSTTQNRPLRLFVGHTADITSICFHQNSNYVITGSVDRTVRVWAIQTGQCVRTYSSLMSNPLVLACSPDGRYIASGGVDGVVTLLDFKEGRHVASLAGHLAEIRTLSFDKQSRVILSGAVDFTMRVWDIASACKLRLTAADAHFCEQDSDEVDLLEKEIRRMIPNGLKSISDNSEERLELFDSLPLPILEEAEAAEIKNFPSISDLRELIRKRDLARAIEDDENDGDVLFMDSENCEEAKEKNFISLGVREDGSYGTEARYGPQEQKQRLLDAIANEGGIVNYRKKLASEADSKLEQLRTAAIESEQSAQLGLIPTCRSVPVFSMFTEENISVVVGLDRPDEELEEARVELDLQRKVARKRTY